MCGVSQVFLKALKRPYGYDDEDEDYKYFLADDYDTELDAGEAAPPAKEAAAATFSDEDDLPF